MTFSFTFPASELPPIGGTIFVGLPLDESQGGSIVNISDLMDEFSASALFYFDDFGTTNFVLPSDFPGADFVIPGGKGFIIVNGKSPVSSPIVYEGEGWCNVYDSGTQTVSPCPP